MGREGNVMRNNKKEKISFCVDAGWSLRIPKNLWNRHARETNDASRTV